MKLHCLATAVVVSILSTVSVPLALAADGPRPYEKPSRYFSPLEKQFADVEASVPGFAGWYFDKDGNAVVRVKDLTRAEAAKERVGTILESRRANGKRRSAAVNGRPQIKAHPARYSFSELAAFREVIVQSFPQGAHSLDLDEQNNVITLGARDEKAVREIRAATARLHIPASAVSIEVTPIPVSQYSLTDNQRPLRGGVGFVFYRASQYRNGTIGVNGSWLYNNTWVPGFITNSHNTTTPYVLTGNEAYQPTSSTRIGYEFADPTPWSGTNSYGTVCQATYVCRFSDTAFYAYDNPSETYGGGTIAETGTWSNGGPAADREVIGSMNVDPYSYPAFPDVLVVGENLEKMGAASGWTWGSVTATCMDFVTAEVYGSASVLLKCQERASIYVLPGDSGAPIFRSNGSAAFAGILWGGSSSNLITYFSSAFNVEFELGFWRDYAY